MDRETLKDILILTSKHTPSFNKNESVFDGFVNLLDLDDRWQIIQDYFGDKSYDYLSERENVLEEMIEDYGTKNVEAILATQKYTFPISYITNDSTYVEGEKYVHVDLRDAAFQSLQYFGIYDDNSWTDYVSKFTNDSFMINHDEELKTKAMLSNYYEPVIVFDAPIFDMAYNQLLYVAMEGGLENFMESHGCVWCQKKRDAIRFQVIDEDKFKTFENDWPGVFSGINLHYFISRDEYKFFYIEDKKRNTKITLTTTENGDKIVSSKKSLYYPQYKKLILGLPVTENDHYFLEGAERCGNVRLLER